MDFKKSVGEYFRPRNMFTRAAQAGGAALGSMVGQPGLGYEAGNAISKTWRNDDRHEINAMPRAQGFDGIMNLFSRGGTVPGPVGIGEGMVSGKSMPERKFLSPDAIEEAKRQKDLEAVLSLLNTGGLL